MYFDIGSFVYRPTIFWNTVSESFGLVSVRELIFSYFGPFKIGQVALYTVVPNEELVTDLIN